jgi:hypothetical protein
MVVITSFINIVQTKTTNNLNSPGEASPAGAGPRLVSMRYSMGEVMRVDLGGAGAGAGAGAAGNERVV